MYLHVAVIPNMVTYSVAPHPLLVYKPVGESALCTSLGTSTVLQLAVVHMNVLCTRQTVQLGKFSVKIRLQSYEGD